jgi:hypothetical protein
LIYIIDFVEVMMITNSKVRLDLEIIMADATEKELARGESAPSGSKGDPITLGVIAMEVFPSAVPSVIALVQAWVMRGQGPVVKFRSKNFEFEGPPDELHKLLAALQSGKKGKE